MKSSLMTVPCQGSMHVCALEDDTFFVYDLASTNGTFRLTKNKVSGCNYREPLADGDRIKPGRTCSAFYGTRHEQT